MTQQIPHRVDVWKIFLRNLYGFDDSSKTCKNRAHTHYLIYFVQFRLWRSMFWMLWIFCYSKPTIFCRIYCANVELFNVNWLRLKWNYVQFISGNHTALIMIHQNAFISYVQNWNQSNNVQFDRRNIILSAFFMHKILINITIQISTTFWCCEN